MSNLYEIPKSWKWTTLNDIFLIERGGSPRPIKSFITDSEDGINWIKIGDTKLGQKYIETTNEKIIPEGLKKSRLVVEGDFILSNSMSFGRPYIMKTKGAIHDGWLVFRDVTKELDKDFFYYLLSSSYIYQQFSRNASGSTVKNLNIEIVKQTNISLPPLKEQTRIVTKIEKLFTTLDNSDKHLSHLEKQLKRYRQSVLKSAFEGELTREWRENQTDFFKADELIKLIKEEREKSYQQKLKEWKENVKEDKNTKKPQPYRDSIDEAHETNLINTELPKSWKYVKLGETYEVYIGSTPSRKQVSYWNGKINWVSSGEVLFKNILTTKETITEDGLDNTSTNVHPIGTVLLAMIGEGKTRGQSGIIQIEACHNQNTAALRVNQNYLSSKLLYYFFYYAYQATRRIGAGNNQKALNKSKISNMTMPLMSLDEQNEIVKGIEKHLSIIDKLESVVQKSIKESKRLRQSILKQAFEGKLVEQDPNDESAEILLEKIAKAKEEYKKALKRNKK